MSEFIWYIHICVYEREGREGDGQGKTETYWYNQQRWVISMLERHILMLESLIFQALLQPGWNILWDHLTLKSHIHKETF